MTTNQQKAPVMQVTEAMVTMSHRDNKQSDYTPSGEL